MTITERIARFAISLASLVVLCTAVPWLLVSAAQARFGGPAPWSGVPAPSTWELDVVRSTATDRITEALIADLVLRLALGTAWAALVVLLLTVFAEVVHQIRHGGLGLPRVRGLGWGQPAARHLAAGLLVLTSLASAPKVGAGPSLPIREVLPAAAPGFEHVEPSAEEVAAMIDVPVWSRDATAATAPTSYTVEPGDSVFGIAERLTGGDPTAAARLADRILDLNIGRTMAGGARFVNAAYIEPGWVLELPGAVGTNPDVPSEHQHRVRAGDTLWRIAAERLDDPTRWEEIWEANAGRTMSDGRRFDAPGTIHPGWILDLPGAARAAPDLTEVTVEPVSVAPEVDVERRPDPASDLPTAVPAVEVPAVEVPVVEVVAVDAPVVEVPVPEVVAVEASVPEVVAVEVSVPEVPVPEVPVPDAPVVEVPAAETTEPPEADPEREHPGWPVAAEGLGSAPLVGLGRAAALSAGVLAMIAALRARQLRSARPGVRLPAPVPAAVQVERRLRAVAIGDPLVRLDLAVRCLAAAVADRDVQFAVCASAADGTVEFHLTGRVELPLPWVGEGRRWALPGRTPVDQLAAVARTVDAPSPALAPLGCDAEGREVHADLEALGTLIVDAPAAVAEAVVAAIGVGLAGSPFAEAVRIIGVGVDAECLLRHPNAVTVGTVEAALAESTSPAEIPSGSSTFALRARGRGGETWDPTVVVAGPARPPDDEIAAVRGGRGVALVAAGRTIDDTTTLRPDGDRWVLDGGVIDGAIELLPVGLDHDERLGLAELLRQLSEPVDEPQPDHAVPATNGSGPPAEPIDEGELVVRLLGPVEVVDRNGSRADFEKSKVLELIAWMVTHRERSTRGAARAALWEADVRDATFSNVVSAARRSLGRLVAPSDGQPWIGRTQGDRLPLHPGVVLDADLVERRLEMARHLDHPAAIAMLEPAVDLVRGLPFEGTSYLWPDGEGITSRLVLVALEACAELARHHLELDDPAGVLRATERGLRVLPGHEALVALRLRAHGRAGDHAALRREWEAYLRVVASDPWGDGEPAADLVALRDELVASRTVVG